MPAQRSSGLDSAVCTTTKGFTALKPGAGKSSLAALVLQPLTPWLFMATEHGNYC